MQSGRKSRPCWRKLPAPTCFDSTHFFWVDIGSFREEPEQAPALAPFPDPGMLAALRPRAILWSVVNQGTVEWHYKNYKRLHEPDAGADRDEGAELGEIGDCPVQTLDGSAFGGDAAAVKAWAQAYFGMLDTYVEKGWFAGKDQMLFTSVCMEDPDLCQFHANNGAWFEVAEDTWRACRRSFPLAPARAAGG